MKSSPSIWRLLHNVKSTVKITSIFVAFLENMNFKGDSVEERLYKKTSLYSKFEFSFAATLCLPFKYRIAIAV